jgi:hypothetical protein
MFVLYIFFWGLTHHFIVKTMLLLKNITSIIIIIIMRFLARSSRNMVSASACELIENTGSRRVDYFYNEGTSS